MRLNEEQEAEVRKTALILAGQYVRRKRKPEVWAREAVEAAEKIVPVVANFLFPGSNQSTPKADPPVEPWSEQGKKRKISFEGE